MDTKIVKKLDEIIKNMVTKDDLELKLAKFTTKKDLKDGLDDLLGDIISAVEKSKADKVDLQDLEKRVDVIEEELNIAPPINR